MLGVEKTKEFSIMLHKLNDVIREAGVWFTNRPEPHFVCMYCKLQELHIQCANNDIMTGRISGVLYLYFVLKKFPKSQKIKRIPIGNLYRIII